MRAKRGSHLSIGRRSHRWWEQGSILCRRNDDLPGGRIGTVGGQDSFIRGREAAVQTGRS